MIKNNGHKILEVKIERDIRDWPWIAKLIIIIPVSAGIEYIALLKKSIVFAESIFIDTSWNIKHKKRPMNISGKTSLEIYIKSFAGAFWYLFIAISLSTLYSLPKVKINEVIVIIDKIRKKYPASDGFNLFEIANVKKNPIRTEITLINPDNEYPKIFLERTWLSIFMDS